MKIIKIILIALFVFLLNVNTINAMTLKPSGNEVGVRGENIELYITISRDSDEKEISAVDGMFIYDSEVLTLLSSSKLIDDWTEFVGVRNDNVFCYANLSFNNLITDNIKSIVKLNFKIKENAKYGDTQIKIINPSATDKNGDGVTIEGGIHTLKIVSEINTLTDINVQGTKINFNEEVTDYNLTIDSDSTVIEVSKKDDKSSITGDIGTKKLKYGLNVFKIKVTSESNVSRIYTLNITRPDNRSKINTLSSLRVDVGKIKFNEDIESYNLTVDNSVRSAAIIASLTDDKSTFVKGFEPRTVNLDVGKNIIEIKIKAENEKIKTYTITITRNSIQDVETENEVHEKEGIDTRIILIGLIGILLLILIIYSIKKFLFKQS